jgi:hypothetical protein
MVLMSVIDRRWEMVMIVSVAYPYTFVPDQDSVYQFHPVKGIYPWSQSSLGKGCHYLTTVDVTLSPESHRSSHSFFPSQWTSQTLLNLKRGG